MIEHIRNAQVKRNEEKLLYRNIFLLDNQMQVILI